MDYTLACTRCGRQYDPGSHIFRCDRCGGILEVRFDYRTIALEKNFWNKKISQRKYATFFPINRRLAGLGEGGTRLIRAKIKELERTGTRLYLKIETTNPTRSFKDRGSSVEITKALELGYKKVVCASTGNMGLSIATYARRNRIACTVFISRMGNKEKMDGIKRAGAKLVKIDGDFNKATLLAEKYGTRNNALVCGDYHYRKEGQKSVAFEVIEQLRFNVPDYIFVQVGNATLLAAMHKGLSELKMLGKIKSMPRLIAVQAAGCDPLVRAYKKHAEIKHVSGKTIADAIEVGFPTFGREGIDAVKHTRGGTVTLSDSGIMDGRKILSNDFGIQSEPGGATGFAGFMKMHRIHKPLFRNKAVVAIITGNNENAT